MKASRAFIAFGNKLENVNNQFPGWNEYNAENDREFMVLLATVQSIFNLMGQEEHDLIVPLASLNTTDEEVDSIVEKYQ